MAVASTRSARWFQLGPELPEGVSTMEALEFAGLAHWNVRLEPTPNYGRCNFQHFDTVRDNPIDGMPDTLGRVKGRYTVIQNEEAFAIGDNLVHGGGSWEMMGSHNDGATVFGVMYLGDMELGRDDLFGKYLILHTSHDGTSAMTVSINTLRYRCTNSLGLAIRTAPQSYKIRHSQSAEGRVQEAREVLGLANNYFDEFDLMVNDMINTFVDGDDVDRILKNTFKEPDEAQTAAHTRWEHKIDDILDIYTSDTCDNVFGTKWGVFSAMEEYIDWNRSARGGNDDNLAAAFAGLSKTVNDEKDRILRSVLSV